MQLQPQSGRYLQPRQTAGITQAITLNGVDQGKGETVKLRWKASYKLGSQPVNEQGEISSLGIS